MQLFTVDIVKIRETNDCAFDCPLTHMFNQVKLKTDWMSLV